jgi:hypothetical protein
MTSPSKKRGSRHGNRDDPWNAPTLIDVSADEIYGPSPPDDEDLDDDAELEERDE